MPTLKTLARWLPAIAITLTSIILSSMPTIQQMPTFWNADKLVHLICFGGLAFWVAFATDNANRSNLYRWLVPVIITSLYGACDEIHQSFTPGRSCSIFDWLADTIGAMLGSLAYPLTTALLRKLFH